MTSPRAYEQRHEGWPAVRVDVPGASLVLLPSLGAKIVSLRLADDPDDFLWQDETRPYRQPEYAGSFGDYDASGFDECFPTIGECAYPDAPWQGVSVPDHGELWTLPWEAEVTPGAVVTRVDGVRLPYRFERRVGPGEREGSFLLAYRATNLSASPLKVLWSAHPLFAARPGMQVLVPGGQKGRVVFAAGGRIAGEPMAEFTWPWAPGPAGEPVHYGRIGPFSLNANDKVVIDTPAEGWCALYDPASGRYCGFRLVPDTVPYVAVCVNHGWWPPLGRRGYWVAIEPCTGYPDPLDGVIARGLHATLAPHGFAAWSMELCVGRAASAAEVAGQMERADRDGPASTAGGGGGARSQHGIPRSP